MKTKIEVNLKPFIVPNFVVADEGKEGDDRSWPLEALDAETLDRMCNDFRDGVFKKAKKQQPARCAVHSAGGGQ